jgi:hypothetical protein
MSASNTAAALFPIFSHYNPFSRSPSITSSSSLLEFVENSGTHLVMLMTMVRISFVLFSHTLHISPKPSQPLDSLSPSPGRYRIGNYGTSNYIYAVIFSVPSFLEIIRNRLKCFTHRDLHRSKRWTIHHLGAMRSEFPTETRAHPFARSRWCSLPPAYGPEKSPVRVQPVKTLCLPHSRKSMDRNDRKSRQVSYPKRGCLSSCFHQWCTYQP